MMTNNKLDSIYYNPHAAGSFGGIHPLVRASGATESDVRKWLISQDTYTLHKPPIKKFQRRKTVSTGVDDLWQADLVDLSSLTRQNDGNKFILTIIDVFSKFAWVCTLKNKSSQTVTNAFSSILGVRRPTHLQTDKGTKFLNTTFQKLLAENNIKFYTSQNEDIK